MTQGNTKTDFLAHIRILNDISNLIKYKNIDYLIFFSLGENDESVIVTITDGFNQLWAREIDYTEFQKIRKDLGLEGAFSDFFKLMKDAILQTNGNFKIDTQPSNHDLDLTIFYKISKTATLTGQINIGTPMSYDQDKTMFRQFVRKTLFDLQISKKKESQDVEKELFELREKLKAAEDKIATMSKNIPQITQNQLPLATDATDESKRRKAQTSLINPNIKKRKGMGAKIGG